VYNRLVRPGLFPLGALVSAIALAAAPAWANDDLVLDLGGTTLETRPVVHGSFVQGSASTEPGHTTDEDPAHQVTISRDFWIGKFPVTKGQFAKFVTDTRYVTDAEKGQAGGMGWDGKALVQKKDFSWKNPGFTQTDEHPVVLVTYGDATAFTGWASRKTGKRVRLPSEAEWEFAARGGTTTPWYGGEVENGTIGWFKSNAGNGTRPVGQKKANPLGLFDMSGNVFEWCRDIHGPYREGPVVDPEVTTNTGAEPDRRVLRGGSWLRDVKRARSGARHRNAPGSRNADNGFRVVVTNEEPVGAGATATPAEFAPATPLGTSGGGAASSGSGSSAPSGPLADGEPLRLDPIAHAPEAVSWGVLLASPLAAASAVVAWMLLRKKRPSGVRPKPAPRPRSVAGVSTRVGEDGFFVRAAGAPAGSRARYEHIVNGSPVIDVVPLAGDETFVYTGAPPIGIRILEIVAGAPARPRTPDRPLAPPGVDAGLIPPSSRPRPPPVPARKPAPASVPAQTVIATTDRESPAPIALPLVTDPASGVTSSPASDMLSSNMSPPSDASSDASPPSTGPQLPSVPLPPSTGPQLPSVPLPPPSGPQLPIPPAPPSSSRSVASAPLPPSSSRSVASSPSPPSSRSGGISPLAPASGRSVASSPSPPSSSRSVGISPLAPASSPSGDASPSDASPSDAAPNETSPSDATTETAAIDAAKGEAFLGNPRAY
jgi:formylglycine-generating enzyme